MKLSVHTAVLTLAISSAVACAQMPAFPPMGADSRVQIIDYRPDQVITVRGEPGYQVAIELAPDERIESIALGDSGAWQVTANRAGNRLFVKPLGLDAPTNMTVVTDVRTYAFELIGGEGEAPYAIRFRYPAAIGVGMEMAQSLPMIGQYRLRGDRSLYPATISDDGVRMWIDWPPSGPLPAVYGRDRDGVETLVNGNMRGRFFVIDEVIPSLVFRVDDRRARADRLKSQAN